MDASSYQVKNLEIVVSPRRSIGHGTTDGEKK